MNLTNFVLSGSISTYNINKFYKNHFWADSPPQQDYPYYTLYKKWRNPQLKSLFFVQWQIAAQNLKVMSDLQKL